MKIIFDDGKEIEFDENEVALQDHRERIFKKDGIWYITKIINKDFAKWLDETKPMIIEEKKIPEKFKVHSLGDKDEYGNFVSSPFPTNEELMNKINEIIDILEMLNDKIK